MTDTKELRKQMQLTQAQLAALIGYTQSYVSMVERGKRTPSKRFDLLLNQAWAAWVIEQNERDGDDQANT
jgi:transcriptional regulator with XRE-family HTH domain